MNKDMVAEIVRRNEIVGMIVSALFIAFLILGFILTIREHRAKMRQIKEDREWQGVQIARGDVEESCGKTWYRMN